MMNKYERRRLNLLKLRHERCDGRISQLAEKIDRAPSYVSRMLYPEGKVGKKRIAEDMVEVIENAFNLPTGWLNTEHNAEEKNISQNIVNNQNDVTASNNLALVDKNSFAEAYQVAAMYVQLNEKTQKYILDTVLSLYEVQMRSPISRRSPV